MKIRHCIRLLLMTTGIGLSLTDPARAYYQLLCRLHGRSLRRNLWGLYYIV